MFIDLKTSSSPSLVVSMRTSTRADANAVVAYAIHRTVTSCFICFTHIIPFRAAHLPRYLPTRRDAASPWFICLASHPKETHRPGASRRRGETPHLLEPPLIEICDQASNSKQHDETPIVHKTPSLPLRPMLRAPQPPASDAARQDVSPPQGNTGPLHGDAASSRVTPRLRRGTSAAP